jgi:hypothetical protein
MPRLKATQLIRTDAINMGIKKARTGCISCMHAYFALAKSHGATDEEIEAARQQTENAQGEAAKGRGINEEQQEYIGRRQLLKIAASTGLASAAAGGWMWETTQSVYASEDATGGHGIPMWWGTDSSSIAGYAMPQNFYVGRMGYGGQPAGDGYFFNIHAAKRAGYAYTFGYWGIIGPKLRPAGLSAYGWGQRQAACAWNAWHHGPNAAYHGGLTIFGDVEMGFGGWQARNYGPNKAVLSGFLHELITLTPHHVWPGVYTSPEFWTLCFGQGYRPSTDFVLWLTGCHTCGNTICSPADPCSTPHTARATMTNMVNHTVLGGRKAVMWQYWISSCGCGDYNLMTQHALSLVPINVAHVYHPC